jgi:hypothetical protein
MIYMGHCDVWNAWRNRHTPRFPMGYYCAVEVTGAEAIMTMIPEPRGRRTYGMCESFFFSLPRIRDVWDVSCLHSRANTSPTGAE